MTAGQLFQSSNALPDQVASSGTNRLKLRSFPTTALRLHHWNLFKAAKFKYKDKNTYLYICSAKKVICIEILVH